MALPVGGRRPSRNRHKRTRVLTFVVPAHNEAAHIEGCLDSIHQAAGEHPHEVVVVDDDSSDSTARLARAKGAEVESVQLRHIAAVRNTGAHRARGEVLFFIDADTRISRPYVEQALQALRGGAVGGGARFRFDGPRSLTTWWLTLLLDAICRLANLSGGCALFCSRDAFRRIGGFDTRYFASEEIHFARRLKRLGRFQLVRATVLTSGRKLRAYSFLELARLVLNYGFQGDRLLEQRAGLELWYARRDDPGDTQKSPDVSGLSRSSLGL